MGENEPKTSRRIRPWTAILPMCMSIFLVVALMTGAGAAGGATSNASQRVKGIIGDLNSVSCPTATMCVSVGDGDSTPSPFIVALNDGHVVVMKTPKVNHNVEMTSVSCPSAQFCVAVGESNPAGAGRAVALTYNGHTWRDDELPHTGPFAYLNDVSCSSSSFCLATGSPNYEVTRGFLVEVMRHGKWSIVASTSKVNRSLDAVSCTAWNFCLVLGDGGAQVWRGRALSSSKSIPGPTNQNQVVSCVKPESCLVVGTSAEWLTDGKTWKTAPSPTGWLTSFGVSCSSSAFCATVGWLTNSLPSAEFLTSGRWSRHALPPAVPLRDQSLVGVSCFSATACTAVGSVVPPAKQSILIDQWNGSKWTVEAG